MVTSPVEKVHLRALWSRFQEDSFSTSPLRRAPYPVVAVLLAIAHLACTKMGGILQQGIPWLPSLGAAVAATGRALVGVWIFAAVAKLKAWVGHFFDLAAVVLVSF